MDNSFRITDWEQKKAGYGPLLSGTTHEIIVAMLEHIAALQYRVELLEHDIEQLKEQSTHTPPAAPSEPDGGAS